MSRVFSGLWKNPDFLKLWLGQAVSEFGSHISRDAIPILIFTDLARLVTLLAIPLMALSGTLSITTLVARNDIPEGNSKLATTDSLVEIGGPAVTGLLIQTVTAPFAVLFDAAPFLVSAMSVAAIRAPEPAPRKPEAGDNLLAEVIEGVRIVAHHPMPGYWHGLASLFWQLFYHALRTLCHPQNWVFWSGAAHFTAPRNEYSPYRRTACGKCNEYTDPAGRWHAIDGVHRDGLCANRRRWSDDRFSD